MSLQNRTAICDICGYSEEEERFGVGWPGWGILNGIAAVKPEEGVPLTDANMTTYVCPQHMPQISDFLTKLQEDCKK